MKYEYRELREEEIGNGGKYYFKKWGSTDRMLFFLNTTKKLKPPVINAVPIAL